MKYLNALNKISGVGPQKLKALLNLFGTSEQIWKADLDSLKKSSVGENLAEKIFLAKKEIDPDKEWENLAKENISVLKLGDENYPRLLSKIHNPPLLIYQKGDFDLNAAPIISIVGSRVCTDYGARAAENFARELCQAGFFVASGMAMGIDSFAHKGTLFASGKTIAVLGNSLDEESIYPKINLSLSQEISSSGALLSEYPPKTSAGPMTFPARNRIVAGISLGTLVVEAGEKSGALITAQMALDAGREVFAVPGPIYSSASLGTNRLIQKGAKTVITIKDILEELSLEISPKQESLPFRTPATEEEKILLEILSREPLHIDKIAKLSKLQTAHCGSALALLEIKGWAKNIGGQNYILT
jgi:DNA processing protein